MFQFIHFEVYSRSRKYRRQTDKQKKRGTPREISKRTIREIAEEAMRSNPDNCPHVKTPVEPEILYGISLNDVVDMLEEIAEEAIHILPDGRTKKLRKDSPILLGGVVTFPREEYEADPERYEKWKKKNLKWLKKKYGEHLACVVEHLDEDHPHLHFYAVPTLQKDNTITINELSDAHKARDEMAAKVKQNRLDIKENKTIKALPKSSANDAFKAEMVKFQDEYFNIVESIGMSRLGPARRRMTRKEWKAEKKANEKSYQRFKSIELGQIVNNTLKKNLNKKVDRYNERFELANHKIRQTNLKAKKLANIKKQLDKKENNLDEKEAEIEESFGFKYAYKLASHKAQKEAKAEKDKLKKERDKKELERQEERGMRIEAERLVDKKQKEVYEVRNAIQDKISSVELSAEERIEKIQKEYEEFKRIAQKTHKENMQLKRQLGIENDDSRLGRDLER